MITKTEDDYQKQKTLDTEIKNECRKKRIANP